MNFEDRIKSSLDHGTQAMDIETVRKLQSIRHQALNQPEQTTWLSTIKNNLWISASGLVFCSLMIALVLLPKLNHIDRSLSIEQTAMVELIAEPAEIDVLSDPAFYLWLDEQEGQSV